MIEIELNGKKIQAQAGQNIIELTDGLGVDVPRFCYHKHLSIAANCRMCLVDVEGMPKPQPACSTPVNEGMKIWTHNDKAKKSQKAVMEFLLINHPLDCPICDQGGECELQDVAFEYGADVSQFTEGKRVMADGDIGAFIQTDMTRCIHCTRCVRFGTEIAGLTEMGATGRGENLTIEPFLKQSIDSELSGNMIDVCPVGALTSKPFRYQYRSWELTARPTIARHDNIGSHIWAQTFDDEIKRIVPRENEEINQTWIANRERFSYDGLGNNRVTQPKIKIEGQWQTVSWQVGLEFAAKHLKKALNIASNKSLAMLASNHRSLENYYLWVKLAKSLDITHYDYRLSQPDLTAPLLLSNGVLDDISDADYILLIGGNTRFEQPMLNHRIRQASLKGATIDIINSMVFDENYVVHQTLLTPIGKFSLELANILVALLTLKEQTIPDNLANFKPNKKQQSIAQKLINTQSYIVLGEQLSNMPDYGTCLILVSHLMNLSDTHLYNASMPHNSMAANLAGFLPKNINENLLEQQFKSYLLFDLYPDYDCQNSKQFQLHLAQSDFVLAFNSFTDPIITQYADVILPIAHFYEEAGTFINASGEQQFSTAVAKLYAQTKPVWKVMRVLAELLNINGFEYDDIGQIQKEIQGFLKPISHKITHYSDLDLTTSTEIKVISRLNPYCSDVLLRASNNIKSDKMSTWHKANMNTKTANKLDLSSGDNYQDILVNISNKVADNSIVIYRKT